jgi:hypothetical protein
MKSLLRKQCVSICLRPCGENHFRFDQVLNDDALITCEECVHLVGSLEQLKTQVSEQVLRPSDAGKGT